MPDLNQIRTLFDEILAVLDDAEDSIDREFLLPRQMPESQRKRGAALQKYRDRLEAILTEDKINA